MDFFKSVFSEDPESSSDPNSEKAEQDPTTTTQESLLDESPKSPTPTSSSTSVWSFGGMIKTIASKSESVLQTYKKDLEEFSSELKKETDVIRQVASRAVKELPTSLEVGASVAQESLESVGQAIDDLGSSVWRGTAEIITHGKDVLLSVDEESDSSESQSFSNASTNLRRYSRFDSQIRAIQIDSSTYSEEPEDLDEYEKWRSGFVLGDKDEEIDILLSENGVMDSVYRKLVPTTINDETFWCRYFYKVYKLKQVEEARANLVKRAISGGDEEELSWDVDDDEEEEEEEEKGETSENNNQLEKKAVDEPLVGGSDGDVKLAEKNVDRKTEEKQDGDGMSEEALLEGKPDLSELNENREIEEKQDGEGMSDEALLEGNPDLSELNESNINESSEEKLGLDGKNEQVESCKDSDVSVVSSQPSLPEEQDLSWDEIEDLSGIDEKKASASSSPNKADLRKRLSTADEEEDLSWDTEDDD